MQTLPYNIKFLVAALLALAVIGFGGYAYWRSYRENARLQEQIASMQGTVVTIEGDLAHVRDEKGALEALLNEERNKSNELSAILQSEQDKNQAFESQIKDLSTTVVTLQKLSQTDEELLQKYSKVYFLSDNYAPENLSAINSQYLYDKNRPQLIHTGVLGLLEGMLASAAGDGVTLKIVSAHRSFAEQVAVKTGHEITYGSGANQFSADQGYSEHQLGTTVDITTPGITGLLSTFEGTNAYKWLTANAYKFGFTISYPKSNIYYYFEPWHWRFVGIALATKLHNENKYFYELTQRELDEYLISIFD